MLRIVSLCLGMTMSFLVTAYAQQPAKKPAQSDSAGSVSGKLTDAQNNSPIEFASVAVLRASDSTTLTGMLSTTDGGFKFPAVPFGKYIIKVNFIGYNTVYTNVVLSAKTPNANIGSVKLGANVKSLAAVEIVAEKPTYQMAIDKRVFNVDKSLSSVGGTATDVLKQVPSVNVDIDGNVSVRNGTPTIYVDGRPTTLTLDQIPADAIASIEVVTNPSSKYEAEGVSGILNIVLKKDRKSGMNGNVNAGISSLKGGNGGFDFNIRREKFNFSVGYNFRTRLGDTKSHLFRKNLNGTDTTFLDQFNSGSGSRKFQNARVGLDWFMDSHNTIGISQSINTGNFTDKNNIDLHDLANDRSDVDYATGFDNSVNKWVNYTTDLNYKHTFAKEGHELSADVNYNYSNSTSTENYDLQYYDMTNNPLSNPVPALRNGYGKGNTTYVTAQLDYVNPLSEKTKLEAGLRTNSRIFNNVLNTMGKDFTTGDFVLDTTLSNNYHYSQTVNAAYASFSGSAGEKGNFGYQAGLRAEQSFYSGEMKTISKANYKINYPVSLFPSLFLSEKLKGDHEFQLNYTRRVARPWFRDLLPNLTYSGQSANRGNPDLRPEFTNSFEFNYLKDFAGKHNVLVSLYYRNTQDAITNYSVDTTLTINGETQKVVLSYPVNANTRNAYGAEFTVRDQILPSWDITSNLNLMQTKINAKNLQDNLTNQGFGWFAKVNSNTKLPYLLYLQVTGNYQSKQIQPQGETAPQYTMDIAIKKEFLKKRNLAVSLALNDIFNTDRNISYTNTDYSEQEYYRKRASRELRLNVQWRFGKMDMGKKKDEKKSDASYDGGGQN
jgi:iron complex outermembrane recepter protein